MPAYVGVNAPHYARGEFKDTEPPHDYDGNGPHENTLTPVSQDGISVPLNGRDQLLIGVMDKWAEANKLEGHAKAMKTSVHRARLGSDDEKAAGSADKSRRLRSEARGLFEQATGVKAMVEAGLSHELGDIGPEVLVLSYFQDFKSRHLVNNEQLNKQRQLHRKNLRSREG